MARVVRCKLCWRPSKSAHVVGYRLYWSKRDTISYDSGFFELGKTTEVYLPDVLKIDTRYEVRIKLAVTAIDKFGNESDMIALPKFYQTICPAPPADILLTELDETSGTMIRDGRKKGSPSSFSK